MSKKKWKIAALLALSCLVMSPVLAFDAGDVARLVETRSCPGGDLRGRPLKTRTSQGQILREPISVMLIFPVPSWKALTFPRQTFKRPICAKPIL